MSPGVGIAVGEAAAPPLPRKRSLHDLELAEPPRQCSSSACPSPVSWAKEECGAEASPAGCARRARLDAGAGGGGSPAADPAAPAPATTSPPVRASLPAALLRTCGPSGSGGGGGGAGVCSISVYCSATFGALGAESDDDEGMEGTSGSGAEGEPGSGGGSAAQAAACCSGGGEAMAVDCCCAESESEQGAGRPQWPDVPDDILRKVCGGQVREGQGQHAGAPQPRAPPPPLVG